MKGLVCILLLLETFVFVVQQQVDGGLNENEISQQISSEDGRQNPPQTDTLRAEASTDSQQYCDLGIPDIHAALRELTATVTEQRENIRELTATVTEQRGNIRALEMQLREQQTFILEELTKKNEGIFTAPLKGAYMFRISIYGRGGTVAKASIYKNGEHVVITDAFQTQNTLNPSNGVVLILEVGDVVYITGALKNVIPTILNL
ncbi:hypothetical protein DPX16_0965 [Anabarilius grahami]|uniref:C1q domain-containing protein n=1 Tax=Anabarilius grahami TaxID=495550 RepID=A0A3N0YGN5_ANAGA|nr:hypothetical protein DPX16_0965 [Anabarilius grahami]